MTMLPPDFFDRDACVVARSLLGKVIRRNYKGKWLAARIIETEAYYLDEKGSHASLGYTEKRKALFMPAGTIYMYYARGKDSLNISCRGKGNAVLIKSAFPFEDRATHPRAIAIMQSLNPTASGERRPLEKLCSGQTLLCRAMAIKVSDWDQQQFDRQCFYFDDADATRQPRRMIKTTRMGIPQGRDEHLHYRFIDYEFALYCTSNPLSKRDWQEGRDYRILTM
jgi:DNA-3-methyladenine glycosylase